MYIHLNICCVPDTEIIKLNNTDHVTKLRFHIRPTLGYHLACHTVLAKHFMASLQQLCHILASL